MAYLIRNIKRGGRKCDVWVLVVALLIVSGITYRVLAGHLKLITETPIQLPVPLKAFPLEIGNWVGKEVSIPDNILRVAGNDDFLNRLYVNKSDEQWVNVYIAYTANPRTMLGHRPDICYIGGGWIQSSVEPTEVVSEAGRKIPCLIHRFHTPAPQDEQRIVLNFYVLNGVVVADEKGFSGIGWRTPNISGNPARYVAQIQISSVVESSVVAAAENMVDMILKFLPGQDGNIDTEAPPITLPQGGRGDESF